MKKIIMLLAAAALFPVAATAQDNGSTSAGTPQTTGQTHVWQGYLLDARTAAELMKEPSSAAQMAADYSRATALAADPSLGFGVYADGSWLKFDATGNSQVQSLLTNSKTDKGLLVQVAGTLNGDTIAVTSIQEAANTSPSPNQ